MTYEIDGRRYENADTPAAQLALDECARGELPPHGLERVRLARCALANVLRDAGLPFTSILELYQINLADLQPRGAYHRVLDTGLRADGLQVWRVELGRDLFGWIVQPFETARVLLYAPETERVLSDD
jgi:hypothetical protein